MRKLLIRVIFIVVFFGGPIIPLSGQIPFGLLYPNSPVRLLDIYCQTSNQIRVNTYVNPCTKRGFIQTLKIQFF